MHIKSLLACPNSRVALRVALALMLATPLTGLGQLITSVTDTGGAPPLINYNGAYASQRENDSGYPNANPPVAPAIVPFGNKVFTFTDRTHQYVAPRFDLSTGALGGGAIGIIPPYLVGGEYVATRNDNKSTFGFQIDVVVSQNVTAYLLIDNRHVDGNAGDPPGIPGPDGLIMTWVANDGWAQVDTGLSPSRQDGSRQPDYVGIDEGRNLDPAGTGADFNNRPTLPDNLTGAPDNYFTVYAKEFDAGATISLYEGAGNNMHGLVVVPRPRNVPVCGLLATTDVAAQTVAGIGDPPGSDLIIQAYGDGPVSYTAAELDENQNLANVPWMSLSKTQGGPIDPGNKESLTVTYNTTGMKQGVYTAYVRLTDSCNPAAVYRVKVTLTILSADNVITSVTDSGGDGPQWAGSPTSQRENDYGYPGAAPPIPGIIVPWDTSRTGSPTFAFTDRTHQYVAARYNAAGTLTVGGGNIVAGIPQYLVGGEYVSTKNGNRDNANFRLNVGINPNLTRGVWAYLLIDNRVGPDTTADPPQLGSGGVGLMSWVADEGWTQVNTGIIPNNQPDTVGIDEGGTPGSWADRRTNVANIDGNPNQFYTIYRKAFNPGETIITKEQNDGGINMYGLIVVPKIPCKLDSTAVVSANWNQGAGNPAPAIVTIRNSGDDGIPTSYTVAELDANQNGADVPWFSADKLQGGPIAGGATDTVTITFTPAALNLPVGDYTAYLRITDSCTPTKSKLTQVTLSVFPPDLRLPQRMAPNGTYVEVVGPGRTWDQARVYYNSIKNNLPTFQGVPGDWKKMTDRYLSAIVGSRATMWLPGADSDQVSTLDGFNMASLGMAEGIFKWLDGTDVPTDTTFWNTGEPNDYQDGEDSMEVYGSGLWNDNEVGSSLGQADATRSIYLVYEGVNLAGQGRFQTLFRLGTTANLAAAVDLVRGPAIDGDVKKKYYAINFGDPGNDGDGDGNRGGWNDWPKVPWPIDDPVVAPPAPDGRDNFVTHTVGILKVAKAGTYTFGIPHDDDARFTIGHQTQIGGACDPAQPPCVQQDLPGATVHYVEVTFPEPGEYPVELIHREGAGASYLQLFAAEGNDPRRPRHTFHLVGDVLGGGLAVVSIPDPCGDLVYADADRDGDVDQEDYGVVQACITGEAPSQPPTGNCACFDREAPNGDGDVDAADLQAFEKCATGPSMPWSQALTPDCVPSRP